MSKRESLPANGFTPFEDDMDSITNLAMDGDSNNLFRSEEKFALAMRGVDSGLWEFNLETGEYYFSPQWKNMLGFAEDELANDRATWEKLVHPDEKHELIEQVQAFLATGKESFEIEMRMNHKDGSQPFVLCRIFLVERDEEKNVVRLVGTQTDITESKRASIFARKHAEILEMIAVGRKASDIYDAIALLYEGRHPGLRCSMLELHGNKLLHGGAPSLPKEYCEAVHGLENGPEVGSCGTSTYTGKRVIVECIESDPKWQKIKHVALPHGMRCCWSEPIINSSGKVLGAFGMYYNHTAVPNEEESGDLISAARLAGIVMERDQAQKRIRALAYTDELTELPSRACFYQHIEKLVQVSQRYARRFSLLYVDLDNFKNINDSLGHSAGDLLLKAIASRLKKACREVDFVARLSGDEFCIILEQSDSYIATNIAKRCLQEISQPLELLSRKISPACSVGIAHYPEDGESVSSLLKAADISLYAAKENGKNQYAWYNPELTRQAEYRFQMETCLREAIENQQLTLVYQPQVDVSSGEIIGVEALSRWCHPRLGQVSPIEFIATAERIGMIKPLTEWVLKTACEQAVEWGKLGVKNLRMAVNISPNHFLDKALVPLVARIVEETGMVPESLELEVTESAVQTDPRNLSTFQDLKNLGVQLAIDDFGTGYSTLASLKHLNVDCLKIDKCFVDDMLSDKNSLILISSMIDMGRKLGYAIIAEGVETLEQFEILKKLGCEGAQGYLFSKPADAKDISVMLGHQGPLEASA